MNDRNVRLRYDYIQHLRGPGGFDEKTIEAVSRHLAEFEAFIGCRDFFTLTNEDATGFQTHLRTRPRRNGSSKLSASSVVHTLSDVKAFYLWLAVTKREKRVDRAAIDYFNPPRRL